jgi:hypothetical protein
MKITDKDRIDFLEHMIMNDISYYKIFVDVYSCKFMIHENLDTDELAKGYITEYFSSKSLRGAIDNAVMRQPHPVAGGGKDN